jgi:hypothetical protein
MTLDIKDLELIERLIYKNSDDVAVSIARSFERLENRVDMLESRIYTRISELDDKIDASRQDVADTIGTLRDEMRDLIRLKGDIYASDYT